MITYKYFRDNYYVISTQPKLKRFGTNTPHRQYGIKPSGLWFGKGLQWLNFLLNSHHNLYSNNSSMYLTNRPLYLHKIVFNTDHILKINNEDDAIKLTIRFITYGNSHVWHELISKHHKKIYGIFCNLDDRYNIEKYSRRGNNYSTNTSNREYNNIARFKNKILEHLQKNMPDYYEKFKSNPDSLDAYCLWYPTLSISSGCIWNDKAINYKQSKLIMKLPMDLLIKCQLSQNSIKTLIDYINEKKKIIKHNNTNITYKFNTLFGDSNNNIINFNSIFGNSNNRTKKINN
jgi:hypothetical protein